MSEFTDSMLSMRDSDYNEVYTIGEGKVVALRAFSRSGLVEGPTVEFILDTYPGAKVELRSGEDKWAGLFTSTIIPPLTKQGDVKEFARAAYPERAALVDEKNEAAQGILLRC